jgi:virginiamycin B lyase
MGRGRSRWARARTAVVAVALVASALVTTADEASPVSVITSYTEPGLYTERLVTGPDGALWFGNGFDSIGRISTSGDITNYTGTGISAPYEIVVGSDGALWFTNTGNHSIGRITTSGEVTNITHPDIDQPISITAGPDGALWFTDSGQFHLDSNQIGRIMPGEPPVVTMFPITSFQPDYITAGPDGALWFTGFDHFTADSIGRITTSGEVTDVYGLGTDNEQLVAITAGPDGALWFVDSEANTIGRITTAGQLTTFPLPSNAGGPEHIIVGPDDALWFASNFGAIGRITTAGQITVYTHEEVEEPYGLTVGPDGALWFADYFSATNSSAIGRLELVFGIETPSVPAAPLGAPYARTLVASDGVAPYTWGLQSGRLPPGLSLSASGVVSGTPVAAGTYPVVVKVTDSDSPAVTATQAFSIRVAGFGITTASLPSGQGGKAYAKTLAAAGGTKPYKWKKLTKLPKGLKLKAKTGLISGTPKVGGVYPVTFQVTDKAKPKRTSKKTLTIVVVGNAPSTRGRLKKI